MTVYIVVDQDTGRIVNVWHDYEQARHHVLSTGSYDIRHRIEVHSVLGVDTDTEGVLLPKDMLLPKDDSNNIIP